MHFLNNIQIQKKLIIGFGLTALLTFGMGGFSVLKMIAIKTFAFSILEKDLPSIEKANSIEKQ